MKTVCVFVVGAGLTMLAGCRHVEQSQIVTAFQNAGGGDVGQATPAASRRFWPSMRMSASNSLRSANKEGECSGRLGNHGRGQGVRGQCTAPTSSETHTEVRWCGVLR